MPFQFKSKFVYSFPNGTTGYMLYWIPSLLNTELPDLLFDDKMLFKTLLANQLFLEKQIGPGTKSFKIKKDFSIKKYSGSPISFYSIMINNGNSFHSCENCLTTNITLRIHRKLTPNYVVLYFIDKNDIRYVINIIKYIVECAVDVQIQAIQQKGRELRNLPYLSKRLQGNTDVLSIISGFLVKGTPRKELERMESLKATLNAEMERPIIEEVEVVV